MGNKLETQNHNQESMIDKHELKHTNFCLPFVWFGLETKHSCKHIFTFLSEYQHDFCEIIGISIAKLQTHYYSVFYFVIKLTLVRKAPSFADIMKAVRVSHYCPSSLSFYDSP